MTKNTPKKKYQELSIEEQLEFADTVLGMLVGRCWKDETTDPTGYTITKRKMGEHAGKVKEIIKRGGLMPSKVKVRF